MNLPDFKQFPALNRLREKMGANLREWSSTRSRTGPDLRLLEALAQPAGIEVPIDEVQVATDYTLSWKGQRVVVYIRDQMVYFPNYKFHIAHCEKLVEMKAKNRIARYVVTNSRTGTFVVNKIDRGGQRVAHDERLKLGVCMYCLERLNLQDFNRLSRGERRKIAIEFNLGEFFEQFESQLTEVPKHDAESAPVQVYPENWKQISLEFRRKHAFTCGDCGLRLEEPPELRAFTESHHRNGDRSDCSDENLACLCLYCHAQKPDHQGLKNSKRWHEFQSKLHAHGLDANARALWLGRRA